MSTINIRESLRQLDDDSFCKYDLLTMYDSCPLLDEDKQEIAKLLYDKEDPEVIYQKLCTYFCDDDTSQIDAFNDFVQPGTFEVIVNECVNRLKESCSDAQYNDVANQLEVIKDGELYTTGLAPIEIETGDIEIFVDGNYDSPLAFDSTEDAVNYITDVVLNKLTSTSVDSGDDDVMVYTIYDIVEDDNNRLTAKCMNESTNDFQDIKLGKINSQKVNELLNNMLNNPNYKITDEVKKKIYDKSAPWGLAVQMTSAVDVDGTNGLLSTGDFGGEASFGESIETNFEKDDRVTDGSREGTVLDSDSQKVLVEWDYSETDDIEWVDKSDLSFVECLKESEIPMDTVMKDIQSYLNYHLGSNEDYIKVTNVTNVDKNTVAAEYEVHLSIPTGNDEYERDTEYRSLPFRYKDGKWQPVVTESVYDVKTKTTARKLVDKAKADGKKLSMKDAEEIVDQSYNDKADNTDDFYKSLDLDESHEDDIEPQLPTFNELRKQYKNYTTFKDKEKNSGLIRDLCDQLENKKVSYDIYNHKKDNGMTIFYDDCELVEDSNEEKSYTYRQVNESKSIKEDIEKNTTSLKESLKEEYSNKGWVKRWNFLDNYYKGDLVISKISSPVDAWHVEKVAPNGHTIKHLGNYKSLEVAMDAAEKHLVKNESKSTNESSDSEYWYFTKHGVQPGSIPNNIDVLEIKDTPNGTYFKGNRVLTTKELQDYEIKEKSPEMTESKSIEESLKEEFKKQLQNELYDKFTDLATTPEWGFENLAEIDDYLMPTIEVNDYEGEHDNDIEVEFRAEVNYREMEDVCNTLDKVVKKYDKNAYFEPVQPGIAVAYLKLKDSIHESKGPKANKLRELIDEGVISKDFVVDEFIHYLSEDDIADFLNQYDLDELEESSYGGAFDIEDDQYFTKEEIVEVAEKVCEHLDETYPDKFDVSDVYMETPTIIHVEVISKEGNWASANAKIDMRKIKKPSDIMKYDVVIGDLVYNLRQELEELYTDNSIFTESASEWRYVDSKTVPDFDGFLTDYTWYENTKDGRHVFILGDNDLYDVDPNYADWETDSYSQAKSWFDNYHGFDEEDM